MFFKTNGTITPLEEYQIDEDDLHPYSDKFGVTNNCSFSGKFELDTKDYTKMCELILNRPKPEGKTNNWYRMHGYKMNRRIGRKWISRNMHEFNTYIFNITKESEDESGDWVATINGRQGLHIKFGGEKNAEK